MDNFTSWCLNLGRWGGTRLRLHVAFLLFAAFICYASCFAEGASRAGVVHWLAPVGMLILLGSVILHVSGHCLTARYLGIRLNAAVLAPWGEFPARNVAEDDPDEAFVHLAGPVANLIVCLICAVLLLWQGVDLVVFFSLLAPQIEVGGSPWVIAVKLSFWINALLIFVNLLPAYPFDGGKALQVALTRRLGKQQASRLVQRLSQWAAVVMLIAAFLLRDQSAAALVPAWFALTVLALVMFFGAPAEEPLQPPAPAPDDKVFGYDFSEGYTSLERSSRTLEEADEEYNAERGTTLQSRAPQHATREREEEREVDAILARVHQQGLDSLSEDERRLLERVSARYRNRSGGHA